MCGTDQKIGVFAKACTGVVESDSPAWLHMVDNQDSKTSDGGVTSRVTRVRFQGAASWSKEGSRTNWVMNTSSTTGVLAIANGRLVMSSGSGSAVTIDEKSSARYPRSLGSWPNASLVSVSGGTLVIEHGASFGKQTALELSGEGQVELSAGARQDFATLTIDGEPQPAGIYGGPESGAQIMPKKGDGTYWFSGSGRVRVGGAMDGVMLIVF